MKKLLALFLSALVLMTSVPAFGVFAATEEGGVASATSSTDPIVTEINFAAGNKWADAVYREASMSEETPYVVSFEYYLPTSSAVKFDSEAGYLTTLEGSTTLEQGRHSYVGKFTTTASGNTFAPQLVNNEQNTMLYIWNYSITLGGAAIAKKESGTPFITASVQQGLALSEYGWYSDGESGDEDDMTVHADMRITQIDFSSSNNQWHEKVYRSDVQSETIPYIVSFEYYFTGSSYSLTFASRSGTISMVEGSKYLHSGRNSFVAKCYTSADRGTFAPKLTCSRSATLYMWNFRVTLNGEKISGNAESGDPTAKVTTAPISGFSWYTGETDVAEQPVTENTAILYNEQHSLFDEQAEDMRQGIVNTPNDLAPSATGKTYYVSMSGNNANNGLSPSTAWRDVDAVSANSGKFNAGDVVLFERGGVYRGTTQMTTGVSYGAYGTGPKPCLYASPRNYADASLWKKYATNVWRVEVPYLTDIGNIVFDHGVVCASDYKICDKTQWSVSNLSENYQYFHDYNAGYLYMYYNKGNPGALFDDIEFCVKNSVFYMGSSTTTVTDILIDNLCIKYSGTFGIVFSTTENVTVTNCEIGYIGGSEFGDDGRYGNGIEFNSHVTNALVENNWIYQCYDAGYTNQGSGNATHLNVTVRNNLIEYCHYNIEIFTGSETGLIKDCVYEGNMLRFAGYGFGTNNRYGSNDSTCANVCYWRGFIPSENVVFRNNVFDVAYRFLVVAAYVNDQRELAPIFTDNVWAQHRGPKSAVALQVDTDVSGWLNHHLYELSSKDLATMRASVAVMDKNPTLVIHENYPPSSIAVATAPIKTVYQLGEALDTTGLTLTLRYGDGSTDTLSDWYTVSGFDSATAGTKTVTVTYRGKSTSFNVTVKAPVTLAGIAVATQPTKTVYQLGEELNTAGLTLTLRYSDGTSKIVSDGYTVSGFDSATAGTKIVTVTYQGKTTILNVTVKAPVTLTGIAVATAPTKTEYELGEALDTAGLTLTLRYSDGTTETVSDGYTVSGFDSATAGEKTVTVIHSGKATTFTVTVNAPTIDETDPAFVVETTGDAVRAGETFTVTLNTKNNPGIVSLMVKVGYDADVLELVSAAGQDFAGTSFGPLTANPIAVNWYDTLNPNNTTDGVVAVLTFKVKEDAAAGDTAITLSYNPNNVYDFDFENVTFATIDGIVTVADYLPGDVNADGVLNNKDLGLLQRYLNGWDVDIDLRAAEVTADGQLNNKDLGMLQRYLNGWDVELG